MVSSYPEFGRFLSQQRELRGMSRDDVAKSTKIPPTLLQALEDGQSERLPERVFLQNLIRQYAQQIGLSADDAITRWHEIPGVAKDPDAAPAVLERQRKSRALKTLLLVLALAGIGTGLVLFAVGR